MSFPKLEKAVLVKRYKRFLADVIFSDGSEKTIYCANTGAMTGCAEQGATIYYSTSDNAKRKYAYSWELTHTQAGHWICVNTAKANYLVSIALKQGEISALTGYEKIQAEVKYGSENSRIDFLLSSEGRSDCYVEVKSCTLLQEEIGEGQGFFPDTVTVRGQKHLRELIEMKEQGYRCVLLFAVLHTGIKTVKPAAHLDKKYASLFEQAQKAGVEVICYYPDFVPKQIK